MKFKVTLKAPAKSLKFIGGSIFGYEARSWTKFNMDTKLLVPRDLKRCLYEDFVFLPPTQFHVLYISATRNSILEEVMWWRMLFHGIGVRLYHMPIPSNTLVSSSKIGRRMFHSCMSLVNLHLWTRTNLPYIISKEYTLPSWNFLYLSPSLLQAIENNLNRN